MTPFADSLLPLLSNHLVRIKAIHEQDLREGAGTVYLPHALDRKYPNANKEHGYELTTGYSVEILN